MFFAIMLTVAKLTVLVLAQSLGAGTPTTGLAEPGAARPAEPGSAAGKSSGMALNTTKSLLIPSGSSNGWCGNAEEHCGAGCQSGFGECGSRSSPEAGPASQSPI